MKVMTVVSTRPETIRLSQIIWKLDQALGHDHIFVHTGQNSQRCLRDIFFKDLEIRQPDYSYAVDSNLSFAERFSSLLESVEEAIQDEKPDRVLILGDTYGALATAIICAKEKVPIYHLEAGNRCHDPNSPEESNRKQIDHLANVHMSYVEHSRRNLLAEGIPSQNIYVVGNPIGEIIGGLPTYTEPPQQPYYLATLHRAENVDIPERLKVFVQALQNLRKTTGHKIVFSCHPRTLDRAKVLGVELPEAMEPCGFREFLKLERNCKCYIGDSGTCPEETCIMGVYSVMTRDSTERPELVECGSNLVVGCSDPQKIIEAVKRKRQVDWKIPAGYDNMHVSDIVTNIVLGA